jgi:acyl-CoA thioester hydrolase
VPAPFRHTIRVRYDECDAQGVVYFARYAAYYDVALTELWREMLGSYQAMVDGGTDVVVAELTLRYGAPALFDDLIDLDMVVQRLGETSMASSVAISRDGELLVEADCRHVFIDVPSKAKKPIPPEIRDALLPYLVGEDAAAQAAASRSAATASQPGSDSS